MLPQHVIMKTMKANMKNASNPVRNGYTAETVPTTIVINLHPSLAFGHTAATAKVSAFSDLSGYKTTWRHEIVCSLLEFLE